MTTFRSLGFHSNIKFSLEGKLDEVLTHQYKQLARTQLTSYCRPSPELTLKMLREGGSSSLTAGTGLDVPGMDSSVKDQTDYVSRCLEITCDTFHDDMIEGKLDEYSCIWHGDDDEYCYFE